MPRTPLYINLTDTGPTSFVEAGRLLQEKYGDSPPNIGGFETDVKTLETSASTLVVALADDRFDGKGGAFLKNCQVLDTKDTPWLMDAENAEKLWKLSEELVGEKFEV
jgi:hypothetical protein